MRFFTQLVSGVAAPLFLAALLPWRLAAQSPVVLQTFANAVPGGVIQGKDGALYGTVYLSSETGEVFRAAADGSTYQIIYTFSGDPTGLIQGSDGALYVSASTSAGGLVFRLATDGSGYAPVYQVPFPNSVESIVYMFIGVIQGSDGVLYGVTRVGTNNLNSAILYSGTVFRVNTDGSNVQVLSTLVSDVTSPPFQLANGVLCGYSYGFSPPFTSGFTYEINTDGSGFMQLNVPQGIIPEVPGRDGAIYGTNGGNEVVKMNADGSGYSIVMSLPPAPPGDSLEPGGVRIFLRGADGALYGIEPYYDAENNYVFNLFTTDTDGSGYSVLQTFNVTNNGPGWFPETFIQGSGGVLYGIAWNWTTTGGILFSLTVNSPFFTLNPASVTIANGRSAAFSAAATGAPAPTYQWSLNGTPIPGATDPVLLVTGATLASAGTYACVAANSQGTATTTATLTVVSTSIPGYLTNLAARGVVGSGAANGLFAGFAIAGTGSKQLLIRGIGPGLTYYNLSGYLPDPLLTLYNSDPAEISQNDNWGGTPALVAAENAVGALPLPLSSLDSALYLPLPVGLYSAVMTGVGNSTGIGVVEVYDADGPQAAAKLVNVSARAPVGVGANILFGGFVIGGSTAETVLIRGIGPGLASVFHLTGTLAQPVLNVFNVGEQVIDSNTGWGGDPVLANVSNNVGAYPIPATSQDSLLLVTLPPGSYTTQVSGVNGGTGIAEMEIYEVY